MVNIEYSNFWGWLGLRGITYVYRVSILPASEYKIYQVREAVKGRRTGFGGIVKWSQSGVCGQPEKHIII